MVRTTNTQLRSPNDGYQRKDKDNDAALPTTMLRCRSPEQNLNTHRYGRAACSDIERDALGRDSASEQRLSDLGRMASQPDHRRAKLVRGSVAICVGRGRERAMEWPATDGAFVSRRASARSVDRGMDVGQSPTGSTCSISS